MEKKLMTDIALFICNGHTIKEAVSYFHLSRRTVYNYLQLLRTPGPYYDGDIAKQLNEALRKNSLEGKKLGGQKGHKQYIISEEDAIKYALMIMENDLTYRDLEAITGLGDTTIYNAIKRIQNKDVLEKLKKHYAEKRKHREEEQWKR